MLFYDHHRHSNVVVDEEGLSYQAEDISSYYYHNHHHYYYHYYSPLT